MTHSTIRNDFEQKLNAIENSANEEDTVSSTQTLALQAKAEELEERLASTEKSLSESNQLIKTMEKNNFDENKEQNDQCKYIKNIKKRIERASAIAYMEKAKCRFDNFYYLLPSNTVALSLVTYLLLSLKHPQTSLFFLT